MPEDAFYRENLGNGKLSEVKLLVGDRCFQKYHFIEIFSTNSSRYISTSLKKKELMARGRIGHFPSAFSSSQTSSIHVTHRRSSWWHQFHLVHFATTIASSSRFQRKKSTYPVPPTDRSPDDFRVRRSWRWARSSRPTPFLEASYIGLRSWPNSIANRSAGKFCTASPSRSVEDSRPTKVYPKFQSRRLQPPAVVRSSYVSRTDDWRQPRQPTQRPQLWNRTRSVTENVTKDLLFDQWSI